MFLPPDTYNGTLTDRQDLRIVPQELWERVQRRLKDVRSSYIRDGGQWWGRPSVHRYLLSGMGQCTCGRAITVLDGYNGTKQRHRAHWYGCPNHRTRGSVVCDNNHRARMDWLDGAVIDAIERQVLVPEVIAYATEEMAERLHKELAKNPDKPRQLEAEARKLRKEVKRFLRLSRRAMHRQAW